MADLKQLMQRGTDAFNKHDESTIEELTTDNIKLSAPGGMDVNGIQAYQEFNRNWWTAFPDGKAEMVETIVAGSTAVARGTFKGTHTGVFKTPMGDIEPTNKRLEGRYIQIMHFDGEKVTEEHLLFDRMELMEQLGLVPTPATA